MNSWMQYSRQVKRRIMGDVSMFQYKNEPYELEFEKILTGITTCYKMMIKDNIPVPSNDENRIRDILLLNYLKKRAIKNKIDLSSYRFDREIPEDTTKGRVDIRIISKNDFEIDEAYYVIECKRLDNKKPTGASGLNGKYITKGIMRFVAEYYSSYYGINGMIGFVVEQMNIDSNIRRINGLLSNNFKDANTQNNLTPAYFIKNFKYSYYSIHKITNKKEIKLYHLMFDYSRNIEKLN